MADAFDLARQQIQAACPHRVVLRREPVWTPTCIEEFPTYRCQSCRKSMSWWPEIANNPDIQVIADD